MVKRLPKSWHREEIKAAVRMRGWTLTSLSLYWGLPESACRVALLRPYFAAELAIAEAIGESPRALWPHRYRDNGQPLNPRKSKLTRPRASMHGQNERADLTEPKGQA